MDIPVWLIKAAQFTLKFGKHVAAFSNLEKENSSLKSKVDVLKNRLERCEEERASLDKILSERVHSDLLKERKLVNQLNEENERNQNIY